MTVEEAYNNLCKHEGSKKKYVEITTETLNNDIVRLKIIQLMVIVAIDPIRGLQAMFTFGFALGMEMKEVKHDHR